MTPLATLASRGRRRGGGAASKALETPNAPIKPAKTGEKKRKERPSGGASISASILSRMSVNPSATAEETPMSVALSGSVSSPQPKSTKLDGEKTLEGYLVANGFSKDSAARIQESFGIIQSPKTF